jgi:hypothetical protein
MYDNRIINPIFSCYTFVKVAIGILTVVKIGGFCVN